MARWGMWGVAAALALAAGAAAAQPAGDSDAEKNVRQSQQYQELVCKNPAFRAKRIAQECGPLQGSQFYDGCVASFECGGPQKPSEYRQAPPSETIR